MDPQTTYDLFGHGAAETTLLDSSASGRLHHAWLITGPRGVGKATLAHRFARFLLAKGDPDTGGGLFGDAPVLPESLFIDPEDPVSRRLASGGHGNLKVLTRGVDAKTGRERSEILIGDVRALNEFFTMTSAEDGWRIAIIDSADELNRNAANALLKTLEEPPARSILLLVAHMPGRVLPTIQSRCRRLALRPLETGEVGRVLKAAHPDLAEGELIGLSSLADGSPGRALELAEAGGMELYRKLIDLLARLPDLEVGDALALADSVSGRGKEEAFRILGELLADFIARLVRFEATEGQETVPGEAQTLARLGGMTDLDRWIEVWENSNQLIRQCNALNLDRKQVVVTILNRIAGAVRAVPA